MNIYEHLLVWQNIAYPETITLRKMSAPELLCDSLCGPLPNILETYDLDRQSQPGRRGCHRWEPQNLPFAFCERFGTARNF